MKLLILLLCSLSLTSCVDAKELKSLPENKSVIKMEKTFDEDIKFISPTHTTITFTKKDTCVIDIKLPNAPKGTVSMLIESQRVKCMKYLYGTQKKKVVRKLYNKNPKRLINL